MKNIKYFKYVDTCEFRTFLISYVYRLEDVIGFRYAGQEQYQNNILKEYCVYFKDGEYEYFKVVCFKDFNEYRQSRLGFNGNKLSDWYENANIREYKTKGY